MMSIPLLTATSLREGVDLAEEICDEVADDVISDDETTTLTEGVDLAEELDDEVADDVIANDDSDGGLTRGCRQTSLKNSAMESPMTSLPVTVTATAALLEGVDLAEELGDEVADDGLVWDGGHHAVHAGCSFVLQ